MPAKPLAELVDDCLAPALAAQGFAGRSVVSYWPEIVGERLGRVSRPLRIDWPKRRPPPGEAVEPASLVVRVEGAFALELQQSGPLVLERVNAHLGWRAVGRLVLKQGPVAQPAAPGPPPRPDAATERAIAAKLPDIADEGLRAALIRLGGAVALRAKTARSDTAS